jgi:uncharacterized membrane protein YccC
MGLLDTDSATGVAHAHAYVLRTRVFDLELAAESLVALVPSAGNTPITVEQRARLSASLVELRQHLTSRGEPDRVVASSHPAGEPPHDWPSDAKRILRAIVALTSAVARLHDVDAAEAHGVGPAGDVTSRVATAGSAVVAVPADAALGRSASDRLAVQAGVAVGLALGLGSFISTSHQYWAALPAFQVLSGSDGETTGKGIRQIVAATVASGLSAWRSSPTTA